MSAAMEAEMARKLDAFAAVGLFVLWFMTLPALAQKPGGTLRMSHFDSPASMSMHEESTAAVNRPSTASTTARASKTSGSIDRRCGFGTGSE